MKEKKISMRFTVDEIRELWRTFDNLRSVGTDQKIDLDLEKRFRAKYQQSLNAKASK